METATTTRPCYCNRVRGNPYTPDQCLPCWQYHYSPEHYRLWGGSAAMKRPRPVSEPAAVHDPWACQWRGEVIETLSGACRGPQPVHKCELFGECMVRSCPALIGRQRVKGMHYCWGCQERKPPEPPKPRPNPPIPNARMFPRAKLSPRWFHLIDDAKLAGSPKHFNGGLIRFQKKLYFLYRLHLGGAEIRLAEVDHNLAPISDVRVPFRAIDVHNKLGTEDPRPFIHDGQLWLIANGYTAWGGKKTTNMLVSRIDTAGAIQEHYWPTYGKRRHWEKNWQLFSHEGQLHAVYQAEPTHVVIKLDRNGDKMKASDVADVPFPAIPTVGLIRGGAAPVLHNGEYYSFVHGVMNAPNAHQGGKIQRWYTAGLYTFDSKPPFKPLRYLPSPLFVPDGKPEPNANGRVVFPCGAFYERGNWIISGGWKDQRLFVAAFDAGQIERELVPI